MVMAFAPAFAITPPIDSTMSIMSFLVLGVELILTSTSSLSI